MKNIIPVIVLGAVLFHGLSSVYAAVNSLHGGVTLGANYDSNVNNTPDNEIDQWETTVSAFIFLNREADKGALSLRYGTTFKYNHRTEESDWGDHRFTFSAYRDLSDRLRFNLANTFVKTNDWWGNYLSPTATGIPDDNDGDDVTTNNFGQTDQNISGQIGRQKFWANYFSTSFNYEYAKNSFVTPGYNNRVLEYDEPDKDNYRYDNPWISLTYWFNPQWNTSLAYNYTDARFDISEDFQTHRANFNLSYVHSVQNTYFAELGYYKKDYDIEPPATPLDKINYQAYRSSLGWTHHFSPQKTFSIAAGPSWVDEDGGEDYWTGYFDISLKSRFETGSWYIRADGGLDDRSFDSLSTTQDISDYQRASAGVSWQAAKDLTANLEAYFRTDDFLQNPFDSNQKEYNGTASLSYRLSSWLYLSGRYVYTKVDADINDDDYVDHRFFITLGASKELYRW